MTTATLPRRFMRPVATPLARRSLLVGFGGTMIVGLLVLLGTSVAVALTTGQNAMAGVSVGGVDIAGLDRAAAAERLTAELPVLDAGEAVVVVDGTETTVAFADLGRGYEMDQMLDAAFAVGRGGDPLADGIGRLRTLAHQTALPVIVHPYDTDALAAIADDIASDVSHPPLEAAVTPDGTAFNVRPSEEGVKLGAEEVSTALAAAVDTASPDDVTVALEAAVVPPIVDTPMAQAAADAATAMATPLALTIAGAEGEEPLTIAPATIAAWLSFGPEGEQHYAARIDAGALTDAVAALEGKVDRNPVNAQIAVAAGGGLGGVIAGQDGRELIVDETASALLATLRERAGGTSAASLAMAVQVTEPALTTAEATAARPQMQLVSSWTTNYVPGEGNGFGNNINIPAFDIDGRNLVPGEWFSFWDSIGPVTVERGFQYGGVIIGGRSVRGGAIGGGICSTSTTVFNAALRAGLEMGIRANHYYYIDRYPDGLDATVYMDDNWVQDMTFRNDTANPIVIRGFGGNGFVTFQIWTVPTGRSVVLTDPATSNHRTATETRVVDPSMAPGTARRVEFPHNGHDVTRTRYVYAADGSLLHQNTYFSSYRTVNGITAVGPTAASAAPPADDDTATAGTGDAPPATPGG